MQDMRKRYGTDDSGCRVLVTRDSRWTQYFKAPKSAIAPASPSTPGELKAMLQSGGLSISRPETWTCTWEQLEEKLATAFREWSINSASQLETDHKCFIVGIDTETDQPALGCMRTDQTGYFNWPVGYRRRGGRCIFKGVDVGSFSSILQVAWLKSRTLSSIDLAIVLLHSSPNLIDDYGAELEAHLNMTRSRLTEAIKGYDESKTRTIDKRT